MKLFVASNNKDKIKEIKKIITLNNLSYEIVCPSDFDKVAEPVEDGKTFKENSYIKAKYYYDLYHLPTLADDSGIEIDYFNKMPGVHSARFLKDFNYIDKNNKIIKMMKYIKNRDARFICDICFIKDGVVRFYEGINEGEIAQEQKGEHGFGYDPIFLIKEFNKTEAELGDEYKDEFSHRAKALKKWSLDVKE